LQCLGEYGRFEQDTVSLSERVRVALRRKICHGLTESKPILFVYQLDIGLQEVLRNSVRHAASGPYLAIEPDNIEKLVEAIRKSIGALSPTAQRPVIVADKDIRRFLKKAIEHDFPNVAVISPAELTPEITVHSLGVIGGTTARQTGQRNLSIA